MNLALEIAEDRGQPANVRIGTVTATAPLEISLQSTVITDVGVVEGPLETGDVVALLGQSAIGAKGSSWLVLGRLTPGSSTASAWTEYFPEWTSALGPQPAKGDGTLSGRWILLRKDTVAVEFQLDIGSTTTVGNGRYFFTLPFTASTASAAKATGALYMLDSGTANRTGVISIIPGTPNTVIGTASPNGDIGSATPHVWATGDRLTWSLVYERVPS